MDLNFQIKFRILVFVLSLGIANVLFWLVTAVSSQVQADTFYPSGNIDECKYASSIAVQYHSPGQNVIFSTSSLEGETAGWIESHKLNDIADITFPDAHRFPGVADHVAVPPNTKVQVGLLDWNYTGHSLHVRKVNFFTSKENPDEGDLTKLGAAGDYTTLTFNNNSSNRKGKMVGLPISRSTENRVWKNGQIFYEFTTIQPLQFVSRTAESSMDSQGNVILDIKTTLKNISQYNLCNLRLLDSLAGASNFDQYFCLNSGESKLFEYKINLGKDYPPGKVTLGNATVFDYNVHSESTASQYSDRNDIYNFSARSAFLERDDESQGANWYGIQPSWGQAARNLITVTLIPYHFHTPQTEVEVLAPPKLEVKKHVLNTTAAAEGREKSGAKSNSVYGSDSNEITTENVAVHAKLGDEIKYTLHYRNTGGYTAINVTVKDRLPKYFVLPGDATRHLLWTPTSMNHPSDLTVFEDEDYYELNKFEHELVSSPSWKTITITVKLSSELQMQKNLNSSSIVINNVEVGSSQKPWSLQKDIAAIKLEFPNPQRLSQTGTGSIQLATYVIVDLLLLLIVILRKILG